jgi:DNA-directed RNA polymerase subunit E'/Rpb7
MSLSDIYSKGIITEKCVLSINEIGQNLKQILEEKIKHKLEGKCGKDGFCKPNSVRIITYSSGLIHHGSHIQFTIVLEAMFAFPVEGMLINAVANNITKAGIKASIPSEGDSPIIIFISRDHFNFDEYFQSIKEGEDIIVRVIGQRFELNDPFISVIGELVKERKPYIEGETSKKEKPFVVL